MIWFIRSWRRKRLARRPFPRAWLPIVERSLPFAAALEGAERERFLTQLKVFAWEKFFVGAQGLTVTDEMRVVVSGAAARLVRNLSLDRYDRLTEIVLYPSHYQHPTHHADAGARTVVYGEAHRFGTVVLSWDAVRHGIARADDGHDTAIHEFAHVLDIVDGAFDGTPELSGGAPAYRRWARVLSRRFEQLRARPRHNVLREYGAQNEAEFFAVATETFFEKPHELAESQPDLYEALRDFYACDLAATGDRGDSRTRRSQRRRR